MIAIVEDAMYGASLLLRYIYSWIGDVGMGLWRLRWFIVVGTMGLYLADAGYLTGYSRIQLIVYKSSVVCCAIVMSHMVWLSIFPYVSVGDTLKNDPHLAIAVCQLRGAIYVGTILGMTLGL